MQQGNGHQAPPAFPKPPKSDLFSRLESFLPAMAQENKKLEEAVATGRGHELNIEVEEAEEDAEADSSDEEEDAEASAVAKPAKKKQIIEMNFALGVMDNDSSDSDFSDNDEGDDSDDKALKAALAASKKKKTASGIDKNASDEAAPGFQMRLARPSHKPRPVIQELS